MMSRGFGNQNSNDQKVPQNDASASCGEEVHISMIYDEDTKGEKAATGG